MAYVVAARWVARAGEEEKVAAAVEKLVAPSRAEPGILFFQPHRDPENPRVFYFYEQYVDQSAYETHGASDHFQRHGVGEAIPLLEDRERAFYETWDL
jgi:quinol monooxygenase YgiN